MSHSNEKIHRELEGVVAALEQHRPQLTPLELDRVRRRLSDRSASSTSIPSTSMRGLMRTRSAILTMLVTGLVLSGGGAAMGLSALTSTDSASRAQYGPPGPAPSGTVDAAPPAQSVLNPTVPGPASPVPPQDDKGALGDFEESQVARPDRGRSPAQRERQVELGAPTPSAGGELPFTGYLAMPILLAGLALLSGGLVLRRRTSGA